MIYCILTDPRLDSETMMHAPDNSNTEAPARAGHGGRMLDHMAIGLSALCIVHCAATLLLLATFATWGAAFADPAIHEIGLAIAVALAAVALGVGYFRHRKIMPLAAGCAGLALMATSLVAPHGIGEFLFSISGLSLVIFAHYRNMQH